jgi:hypothetical protein
MARFMNGPAVRTLIGYAAIALACFQLGACSHYNGPVTNAPDVSDTNGPPLLDNYYAP